MPRANYGKKTRSCKSTGNKSETQSPWAVRADSSNEPSYKPKQKSRRANSYSTQDVLDFYKEQTEEERAASRAKLEKNLYESTYKKIDELEATFKTIDDWKHYAIWQRSRALHFEHKFNHVVDTIDEDQWRVERARKGGRPSKWVTNGRGGALLQEFCSEYREMATAGSIPTDTEVLLAMLKNPPASDLGEVLRGMTIAQLKSRFVKEKNRILGMFDGYEVMTT